MSTKGAVWIVVAVFVIFPLILLPSLILWLAKIVGFLIVVLILLGLLVNLDKVTPKS